LIQEEEEEGPGAGAQRLERERERERTSTVSAGDLLIVRVLQGERKIRVFELRQGTRTAAAGRSRIYWDLDFGLNILYI
jgi:hypothetical protein